jgi:hypothetical protein
MLNTGVGITCLLSRAAIVNSAQRAVEEIMRTARRQSVTDPPRSQQCYWQSRRACKRHYVAVLGKMFLSHHSIVQH